MMNWFNFEVSLGGMIEGSKDQRIKGFRTSCAIPQRERLNNNDTYSMYVHAVDVTSWRHDTLAYKLVWSISSTRWIARKWRFLSQSLLLLHRVWTIVGSVRDFTCFLHKPWNSLYENESVLFSSFYFQTASLLAATMEALFPRQDRPPSAGGGLGLGDQSGNPKAPKPVSYHDWPKEKKIWSTDKFR